MKNLYIINKTVIKKLTENDYPGLNLEKVLIMNFSFYDENVKFLDKNGDCIGNYNLLYDRAKSLENIINEIQIN